MPLSWRALGWTAVIAATSACTRNDTNVVRGKGMTVATTMPASERARVYEAAVRGAFEVDESLTLLLDSRILPRGVGLAEEGRVEDSVLDAMKQRGVIRGTCEPRLQLPGVPRCVAARPGYIVRYSPVFTLAPDSVQVYIYVQKYDTPNSEPSQTLRFERAYQVVRTGDDWRAVREGRVPKEIRGEPKG